MAYQVLARKHRPQTFDELVGQEAAVATLKNALTSRKTSHAYLFFGPRGTGKTSTARILAKALNCAEGPTPAPCLKCVSCKEIASGSAIDVLEIDAATHTQVDKVREVIIETVALAPARDRHKIFIIDEAHMLSNAAFNALLKTLEEPPSHVVFMLATTEPQKIPATIFSRCQRHRFRLQGVSEIAGHLKKVARLEKIGAEPGALELLAKAAEGSLRDAVSLLDQAAAYSTGDLTEAAARRLLGHLPEERLLEVAKAIVERDGEGLEKAFVQAVEEGQEPIALLKELRGLFHRFYLNSLGLGELEKPWSELAQGLDAAACAFILRRLIRGLEDMRSSDQARLAVELTLFGLLESPYDLREWVARLEALEKRLSGPVTESLRGPAIPPQERAAGSGGAEPKRTGGAGAALARPASGDPLKAQGGRVSPDRESGGTSRRPPGEPASGAAPSARNLGGSPRAVGLALPGPGSPDPSAADLRPPESALRTAEPPSPEEISNAWPKVIAAFRHQRPALAECLEAARFEMKDGGSILLSFASTFRMGAAERQREIVSQAVTAILGTTVPIEFRHDRDAVPSAPAFAVDSGQEEEPAAEEAAGLWKEITGEDALQTDPGIRTALKIFPGKVFKPQDKKQQ